MKVRGEQKALFRGKGYGTGNIKRKVGDNSKSEGKLTVKLKVRITEEA